MFIQALKSSLFLTFVTIGIFILFGYIYSIIEKKNTKYVLSTFGSIGILFTGVIGTAVHEIGHLIMCILFRHKISNFQLFNFRGYKYEDTLGYVSHKYDKHSLYQKAGNFFIGIGPIVFGTLFMIISFKLLLPDLYIQINISNYMEYFQIFNLNYIFLSIYNLSKSILVLLFNIKNLSNINFYIFIYLMFCVSSHISLSKKDFENSYLGIFSLFFIYFIICLTCIILNYNINDILVIFINYMTYLFLFLIIGLIFSLISLFISFIFYNLKNNF